MDSQDKPKKKFYKRWWFWMLVVIVLIIIGSSSSSPHTISSNGTGTSTPSQQTVFKIGDQIQSGDSVLTVTQVNKNWQSSNEFDTPQNPQDVFVLVTVSLANKGTSSLDLSGGLDFKLQDATGAQHDESLGGVGIDNIDSTSSLAPGGTTTGQVLFEVPRSATSNLTLIYNPLFSFGQPIQVQLQ